MTVEKRIEALETELKLMKSELKQTLVDVRDFLVTLKLPPPPAEVMAPDEVAAPLPPPPPPPQAQAPPERPKAKLPEEHPSPEPPRDELPEESPREELPEENLPEEETSQDNLSEGQRSKDMKENPPQINMLANLIRWVSQAKKQLGKEQLPTFLEVYAISGNLPPEVKEVILELAEVTGEESTPATGADVWSQLILELHGILAGGGSALRPIKLSAAQEAGSEKAEAGNPKPVPQPLKLKLVLPTEDGEKEFSLSLAPEASGNGWDKPSGVE